MTTKRTYGGGCGIAAALDLVGERWALLVVRELLLGPKRFSDLQAGLIGASPNVLSQRLRELEASEVLRRRRLGPPTSSWVYELTEWGRELEPVLDHLGSWGRASPFRDRNAPTSVDSLMLALRAHFDPGAGKHLSGDYSLTIDDDGFLVRVVDGRLQMSRGEAAAVQSSLATDARTFTAILTQTVRLGDAVADGRARVTGDAAALEQLLGIVPAMEAAGTADDVPALAAP